MVTITELMQNADKLAEETVNAWGTHILAGNAEFLLPEFTTLFESACKYQTAKQHADAFRFVPDLAGNDGGAAATEEAQVKRAFVEAYWHFYTKHSSQPK
jgi:hypothetical protein